LIVERRRGSFTGMIAMRALRRRARFILGPILGVALTGYFAYHLIEGDRGFKGWLRLNEEVRAASANLEAVRAQRAALDLKVSNLRPDHVDPDLLDERIRATLNLVAPDDLVIMQPAGRR
jgi:cell division protein FtsB